MRNDKAEAVRLRRNGASYKEIYGALRVPKATLSDWFADIRWSRRLRDKLARRAVAGSRVRMIMLGNIRGKNLEKVYKTARREAREEFKALRYHPLFIAGLMLYWGEGDKSTKHVTRLINSDPVMLRLYKLFLTHICNIPLSKLRAQSIIYPDIKAETAIAFWSKATGVPVHQFTKCSVIAGRHKVRKQTYGTCTIVVSSTYFKVKMREWLSLLPHELMSRKYYATMGPLRV